tara:strand:+ start:1439 stop:1678 length:240 start_codon:yes stop_codon:yes gene_type:complete
VSNQNKYNKAFKDSLSISEKVINEKLKYNDIPEWDSIGHMTLISSLEEEFNITFETDDIIDFSSYEKGKEILLKYKINI